MSYLIDLLVICGVGMSMAAIILGFTCLVLMENPRTVFSWRIYWRVAAFFTVLFALQLWVNGYGI